MGLVINVLHPYRGRRRGVSYLMYCTPTEGEGKVSFIHRGHHKSQIANNTKIIYFL